MGKSPRLVIDLLRLERHDPFYRVRGGKLRASVVEIEQPILIAAHSQLLHIAELTVSVARLYALAQRVTVVSFSAYTRSTDA